MLVRWLVFLHVLAAIAFFLFHGTSAAMAFGIRKETDFARIRAMLDLSGSTIGGMAIALGVMGLTGLVMPFLIHIWDKIYIWASIVLMLGSVVYMAMFNETHYKQLRRLVGLPYMKGSKNMPAEPPSSPEEVAALIKKTSVVGLVDLWNRDPGHRALDDDLQAVLDRVAMIREKAETNGLRLLCCRAMGIGAWPASSGVDDRGLD